ncbi:lasso RiPP family leader peptide-containing protein [Asticcacaulis sp. 201]|nr:lasso RiPP family leader peptide-containing protein [Asticcacaulis sp. 201]MDV6331087.1 lasso RiPP family leader peptide-containing protein [Asticcacaulis sp. 201]
MTAQTKVEYVAPTVEKIGDFESTTLHAATGSGLDADFPTGTKFGDLTFS